MVVLLVFANKNWVGLCIGASSAKSLLGLQLFVDYATGQLGSSAEQEAAARICRVVIAGNSIDEVEHDTEQAVYKSHAVEAKSVGHVRELDDILAQLTVLRIGAICIQYAFKKIVKVQTFRPICGRVLLHSPVFGTVEVEPNPESFLCASS